MRRLLALVTAVTVGLLGLTLGVAASPAVAETVNSNSADCPSKNSVMTSTDWQSSNGYLCAQENHNGDTSIGPDEYHTWTIDTNVDYYPQYNCYDTTSTSVTVAEAFIFGSGSFTATNWLTPSSTENNTRHWSAGMLWTLGAGSVTGFSDGCDVSDQTWTDPPDIITLTKFSATGMPDNNQAVAGQAYDITVTFSPSDVTGEVGLMDTPTGSTDTPISAAGATIENGTASFTWIPAQAGNRTITIGYPGDSTHSGAITDDINLTVTNGVSLDITDISGDVTTGVATAQVDVGPQSLTSEVMIIDTNQINPSTGKPTVMGEAPASNGSATINFKYAPGTNHKYLASVVNSSSQVIGQSYTYEWASPPTMSLSVPATMQQNLSYPITVSFNPSADVATTSILQNGTVIASADAGGTQVPVYVTAKSQGTANYMATYSGSSAMGASQSPTVSSTTGPGWTNTITDVDCPTGSTSCNVYVTVSGTNGAIYNGPVSLYSNVMSTALPPGGANGLEVATKTASNGQVKIGVSNNGGWSYQINAVITDSHNGFLWSNTKSVKVGESAVRGPQPSEDTSPKKKNGQPGKGLPHTPGTRPDGFGVPTRATTVNRSMKVKSAGKRSLSTKCAKGSSLLHAEALSTGPRDAVKISMTEQGATFQAPKSDVGHRVKTQLLCRKKRADVRSTSGYALGTVRADRFRMTDAGATAFGGLGADKIVSVGSRSATIGGFAGDTLRLKGKNSVSDGGPGDDVIVAAKKRIRALLVGGSGSDRLVGSRGHSVLDARDGSGNDRLICRSKTTRVLTDPGDTVKGPCVKKGRNA